MKQRVGWVFLILVSLLLGASMAPAAAKQKPGEQADVRILIDISGSMKQNDPHNLRRPALRMLVGLLPKETRAGVWTFGQYVNMQIPLGQADKAWKRRARAESKKIASPGQRTNIEEALHRATEDWSGPPTLFRRNLILLTDGMVDISRDSAKNHASRERILQKIVPRLQQLKVSIHTIALSKNADHELMQALAQTTGGWYEQVDNAEQLKKVFLRMFEKVGKPDTVPFKDNKFSIDDSITEATVLVFRKPDAKPTQVIPPSGKAFGASNLPDSVSWHQDEGYDMFTITNPEGGEWRVRAEVDPDNRVMVVTDLKMQTNELPNRLVQGVTLPLEVSFTDHGRLIKKQSFLKVVNISAMQRDEEREHEPRPLLDDGVGADKTAADGYFSLAYGGEDLQPGMGELLLNAKGRTFVREKRISYEVVSPLDIKVTKGAAQGEMELQILPDKRLLRPDGVEIEAWLESSEGEQLPLALTDAGEGVRSGSFNIMSFSGPHKLMIKLKGQTVAGHPVDYFDGPMEVEGIKPPPAESKPEPEPEPEPISNPAPAQMEQLVDEPEPVEPAEPSHEPAPQTQAEPVAQEAEEEEETDWISSSIWLAVINLLVLALGGGAFWWVRRNRQDEVTLVDEGAAGVLQE